MESSETSREALVIGVSSFGDSLGQLEGAVDHAREFSDLLQGDLRFHTRALFNPTCTEMGVALELAAASRASAVVVHVLSHGEWLQVGDELWVASTAADRPVKPTGWVDLRKWLAAAINHHGSGPPILVVLDVCSAGSAARYEWLAQRAEQKERRIWVIGATEEGHSAYGARFTRAMRNVLGRLALGKLESLDPSQEYLSLDLLSSEVWQELKSLIGAEHGMPQRVTASVRELGVIDTPPLFRNPNYRPNPLRASGVEPALAAVADEVLGVEHFTSRAAGVSPEDAARTGGCCFSGRQVELTALSRWVNANASARGALRVVTGSPGAGKSALIGALVCLAHPELAKHATPLRNRIPQRIGPYLQWYGTIAAVHARNRTFGELLESICRQLGVSLTGAGTQSLEQLRNQLRQRNAPPLVVLDALDEALDPVGIVFDMIVPLVAPPDGPPLCRVLVGTRPWRSQVATLLRLAAQTPEGLIDLDQSERSQLVADISDYVMDLHRELRVDQTGSTYNQEAWEPAARAIAETVTHTKRAKTSSEGTQIGPFLLAQLYLHHLNHIGTKPTSRTAADIGAAAPRTIGQALALDLGRQGTSQWMRPILMAVAHARGAGMPMILMRAVAQAMFPELDYEPAGWDHGVSGAMFYLRSAVDTDGTTLYRLFHQELISDLSERPAGR